MSDQLPTAPLIERFQGGIRADADPRMLAERLLRGSELALEAARRDAADAMLACEELSERILALEAELVQARQEPERLQGQLASERRARRLAEQQAYAERARREELQEELAADRERESTETQPEERGEAEERQRELESEALALRREADELGHLVGSARRARERAERRVTEVTAALERAELAAAVERAESAAVPLPPGGDSPAPTVSEGLAREFAVAAQPVPPGPPAAPDPPESGPDAQLALERELVRARAGGVIGPSPVVAGAPGPALVELREELATLAAKAQRETAARLSVETRAVQLEHELSEQIRRSSRAYDAIEELRMRLGAIGGWSGGPPEERSAAEPSAAEPPAEPARSAAEPPPAEPEPSAAEPPPAQPSGSEPASPGPEPTVGQAFVVETERFSAALMRLREAVPADAPPPDRAPAPEPAAPPPESPPRPSAGWLPDVFRRMAREDPATAGRLLLELLPAQRTVYPNPIAYDLELPGQTCIQLTVDDDALKLELGQRRPPSAVRFAVTGDPASLARLLVAGRIGRRLGRGLPKVTGERHGLQALDALIRAPLSLRQLHDVGVRLEPRLALEVVARMIDPDWTTGSRFALGYRPPDGGPVVYLVLGDGAPAKVSEVVAPELVAGTIGGEPESLLALLDGREPGPPEFKGEGAQLAKVISWVKRAQSG